MELSVGANYTYSRCFSDAASLGVPFPGTVRSGFQDSELKGHTAL